jgi:hypothetical protein
MHITAVVKTRKLKDISLSVYQKETTSQHHQAQARGRLHTSLHRLRANKVNDSEIQVILSSCIRGMLQDEGFAAVSTWVMLMMDVDALMAYN